MILVVRTSKSDESNVLAYFALILQIENTYEPIKAVMRY